METSITDQATAGNVGAEHRLPYNAPPMPFDFAKMEERGVTVPADVKAAVGYREFLSLLEEYALRGLPELRAVNPITRGKSSDELDEFD
jgi:hypothetical protein